MILFPAALGGLFTVLGSNSWFFFWLHAEYVCWVMSWFLYLLMLWLFLKHKHLCVCIYCIVSVIIQKHTAPT